MRVVIAKCSVDYSGRLDDHLPLATRLLMVKADGSVLVHSDGGSYKPLNWMSPPCRLDVAAAAGSDAAAGAVEVWTVQNAKTDDRLVVRVHEVHADHSIELEIVRSEEAVARRIAGDAQFRRIELEVRAIAVAEDHLVDRLCAVVEAVDQRLPQVVLERPRGRP